MKQLVIKYLTDTISNEEHKVLKDCSQLPRNQEYSKNAVGSNQIWDASFSSIEAKKANQRTLGVPKVNKKPIRKIYSDFYQYAAVAVLALVLSLGILSLVKRGGHDQPYSNAQVARSVSLNLKNSTLLTLKIFKNTTYLGYQVEKDKITIT